MKNLKPLNVFLLLVIADQLSKYVAIRLGIATLNDGVSLGLFNGFAQEIYVQLMLLYALIYTLKEVPMNKWVKVFLLSGVISNTIDRFYRGAVVDWLPIPFFDLSNNLADWYIFWAIILFILKYIYENRNYLRR